MLLPCNVSMRALVLCQRDDALTSQLDSFVESLRACVPAQRRRRSLGASARRATASSMVASARHDESVSSLNSGYRGRCSNPLPVGRLSVEAVAAQQNKPAPRHVREEAVAPRRWTRTASIVAGLLRDSQGLWRLAFAHCTDRLPASTLRVSGGAEAMGSAAGIWNNGSIGGGWRRFSIGQQSSMAVVNRSSRARDRPRLSQLLERAGR
jgi:hypothetical protein